MEEKTCQRCGYGSYGKNEFHYHHKRKRSTNPKLKYTKSNLSCLCISCHNEIHSNKSRFQFCINCGDVIAIEAGKFHIIGNKYFHNECIGVY